VTAFSEDGFLDGRVRVRQMARGFRSGLDAVMLAAAVPAKAGDRVLELGAGAGTASLCLAARVDGCDITGVELDAALVALANENATANGFAAHVRFVEGDVLALPRELLTAFDHVLANPPFHGADGETSPDEARAQALQDRGDLSDWLEAGVKRTAPNGTFTVILRADRLKQALEALPDTGVRVFPLWPKAGEPAKRVLLQLRRAQRTPLSLLPGLVLHEGDGQYTPEADGILRGHSSLSLACLR
jgi:tRNA1(Val) A37 N6-methylase TrmN6